METMGQSELWTFVSAKRTAIPASNSEVRKDPGHEVKNFNELAKKVAELQFRNWDHVLMFRGQNRDHTNQAGATSLKPSLLRSVRGRSENPDVGILDRRSRHLERAEQDLKLAYELLGKERMQKHRILRWSILQHYEICDTPLLDVSHSLRISASFASLGATDHRAYLYVLGVPNISGGVTASPEAGLQIIRLASVCPPAARRPHAQEGYLLGEYPEIAEYRQKQLYHPHEIDLGRRLVAKFCFDPKGFWKDRVFPKLSKALCTLPLLPTCFVNWRIR